MPTTKNAVRTDRDKRLSRDQFQDAVVAAVKEKIGAEPWFKGVCVDSVHRYYPDRMGAAVEQATLDTHYWDGK